MMRKSAFLCSLPFASAAQAEVPSLKMPVDCTLGETCFIQHYQDHDNGPQALDYQCGTISYDAHMGTDFAPIPPLTSLPVLAAATGRVLAIRDGAPDATSFGKAAPFPKGQECGNGVLIQHDAQYQSQYCHLQQGSVKVTIGQIVSTGDILGQTGASGNADFPHLHFSLRKNGQVIDPFSPNQSPTCLPHVKSNHDLWAQPIPYKAGGIVALGISDQMPEFPDITAGLASPETMPVDAQALIVWAHLFATRKGDTLNFRLKSRNQIMIDETVTLPHNQDRSFRAVGLKRPSGQAWPKGLWEMRVEHLRKGKPIATKQGSFRIR